MSDSIPKTCRTEIFMSGSPDTGAGAKVVVCISPPYKCAEAGAVGQSSGPRRGTAPRGTRRPCRQMAEPPQTDLNRFEIIIGVNDLAHLVFQRAVAPFASGWRRLTSSL